MINTFDEERIRYLKMMATPGNNPEMVIKAIYDFLLSHKDALNVIKNLDDTMLNQKEIVAGIRDIGKTLDLISKIVKRLSEEVKTEDAKVRLAEINLELGQLTVEMVKILERTNSANNKFWALVLGGIVIIAGISLGIFYKDVIFTLPKGSDSKSDIDC